MIPPKALAAMRFGYGPFAGQLPDMAPADQLSGPDDIITRFPGIPNTRVRERLTAFNAARRNQGDKVPGAAKVYADIRSELGALFFAAARTDIARAVSSETPYRERLVRFWADHFSIRAGRQVERALVSVYVDDAIRPYITGSFAQLLSAATLHPGMLTYLDQTRSIGPGSRMGKRRNLGLNENLARELLELHTLGVGEGYTQTDVTQLAELLTGLLVSPDGGTAFEPSRAEPGAETVLGRDYGSDGPAKISDIEAFLDDLARRPETVRHISRKLAVHFVSDTPDPALIDALVSVWNDTDGDLMAICTALSRHPTALNPQLQKARQPFDFIVAAMRALGVDGDSLVKLGDPPTRRFLLGPMSLMGQAYQSPRGPDGWVEAAEHWITPQQLATRIDWAMRMPQRFRRPLPDAREFVDMALAGGADDHLRKMVSRAE
ncbi:MAG: DUF1800 domain-containing protein, partial [Gemmobacter sp.]|nr:DUF1800 domain-containing protein [Gemmobacter sp.]